MVVAKIPVKFCKVEEPSARMFDKVPRPVEVKLPVLNIWANRFVDDAVVLNMVVEVEFVVVAFNPVKFCKVEEPNESMLEKMPSPVEVRLPTLKIWANKLVDDAVVA